MRNIKIKLLSKWAKIPTQGSAGAAGRDLYADLSSFENRRVKIEPNETVMIPISIAMAIPEGWVGLVFIRSGISMRQGLCLANGVGVIDSDYRGEWMLLVHNFSKEAATIEHNDKIAQVVFVKHKDVVFYPVRELDSTDRGAGGFGSTGIK